MKARISFWDELRTSISQALSPRNIAFYGSLTVLFGTVSFLLPYENQVYLAIAAGYAVALLIPVSMVLSRGLTPLDTVFIGGIVFLIVALFNSALPVRAVLPNARHFSLILAPALSGLYVVLRILRGYRVGSHARSVRSFSDFFSVCEATLSSELCSCLHPVLFLESLGIAAFLPNQVKTGFVLMMITLAAQIRATYRSYMLRRRKATTRADASQGENLNP